MTIIVRPALQVKQGNLTLFTTSLKVGDMILPEFYDIDRLDLEKKKGFQRVLDENRAKKLANYIVKGMATKDAFLPTSIFMATDKEIPFNPDNNTITIDTEKICPFSIVDGQHRAEGLRIAVEKDSRVKDFEIPVNIAVQLPRLSQMAHFLIVNTTQKSVDEGIAQRIRARLSEAAKTDPMPTLPQWIDRLVEKGEDAKILQLIDYLNGTDGSPWQGRIRMANEKAKKGGCITQKSFSTLLKKHYFVRDNPIFTNGSSEETQKKILFNYWKAMANIIGSDGTVLYRYIGV